MRTRAMLGAGIAAIVAAGAIALRRPVLSRRRCHSRKRRHRRGSDASDDVTIRAFLQKLEPIIKAADADAFAALEGPLGSRDDALAFAQAEFALARLASSCRSAIDSESDARRHTWRGLRPDR